MSINFSQGGFMQRPRYEDEIMKQIGVVLYWLSAGDLVNSTNSYNALVTMLYGIPKIDLKDFQDTIKKIDKEFMTEYDKKYVVYLETRAGSICPDVVEPPNKNMPLKLIMRKNQEILKTLGINGLTLTSKNLTHM